MKQALEIGSRRRHCKMRVCVLTLKSERPSETMYKTHKWPIIGTSKKGMIKNVFQSVA